MTPAHRAPLRRATVLGLLLAPLLALTACEEESEGGEVLPMVEVPADHAIRLAVDEVPGSALARLELVQPQGEQPVWHGEVVTDDGTRHLVEVDTTRFEVLDSRTLTGGDGAALRALLDEATILPDSAVREVTDPEYGKVTDVEVGEREGGPAWTIEVATPGEEGEEPTYVVDGRTGTVVG
ncbi:hypothetical protein [Streptomyces sp. GSL17-111]|uniref:hypothetical protein n=1 Tax=Streptomyces sp. GSL17-111 TaxID=3121596 RepID=UPI0030F475CA